MFIGIKKRNSQKSANKNSKLGFPKCFFAKKKKFMQEVQFSVFSLILFVSLSSPSLNIP